MYLTTVRSPSDCRWTSNPLGDYISGSTVLETLALRFNNCTLYSSTDKIKCESYWARIIMYEPSDRRDIKLKLLVSFLIPRQDLKLSRRCQSFSRFPSIAKERYSANCGSTPMYPVEQIIGGSNVKPDEFSWVASLQYGHKSTYGICAGSVINSLYVLTAAHCAAGKRVKKLGGLTGVRLGDFTHSPFCDYGSRNCSTYLLFAIKEKIVHPNYSINDATGVLHNDIALLRLHKSVPFINKLKPICLPIHQDGEPNNNDTLTLVGWGKTLNDSEPAEKRAVHIPLVTDPEFCELQDESRMCAGKPSNNIRNSKSSCEGDSGGPLMKEYKKGIMVIEGIVSFYQSYCGNEYYVPHYTRVRHYIKWIAEILNKDVQRDHPRVTSVEGLQCPKDCDLSLCDTLGDFCIGLWAGCAALVFIGIIITIWIKRIRIHKRSASQGSARFTSNEQNARKVEFLRENDDFGNQISIQIL